MVKNGDIIVCTEYSYECHCIYDSNVSDSIQQGLTLMGISFFLSLFLSLSLPWLWFCATFESIQFLIFANNNSVPVDVLTLVFSYGKAIAFWTSFFVAWSFVAQNDENRIQASPLIHKKKFIHLEKILLKMECKWHLWSLFEREQRYIRSIPPMMTTIATIPKEDHCVQKRENWQTYSRSTLNFQWM